MAFEFDREKFKDAMHYVIAKVGARPGFGATKLYKILWFSEARTFVLTGKPMFGIEFVRQQFGPVPKNAMLYRKELIDEMRVRSWEETWDRHKQWQFRSLSPAPTARLNADEIKTLDYWAKHIDEDHTAQTISDQSHDYGWEIARMGESLPVYAFLAERLRDPTDVELASAKRRLGLLGL